MANIESAYVPFFSTNRTRFMEMFVSVDKEIVSKN